MVVIVDIGKICGFWAGLCIWLLKLLCMCQGNW